MAKVTVILEVEGIELSDANSLIFALQKGYGFPNPDVASKAELKGYNIEWSDGEE